MRALIKLTIVSPISWVATFATAFASASGDTSSAAQSALGPIWAALIGASTAIATIILKDIVIHRINEKRSERKSERHVYRLYLSPLYTSCERLLWRMKEVFIDRRSDFLLLNSRPLHYNSYKRASTLYRIASLLGWIRAINNEISALGSAHAKLSVPLLDQFVQIQSALADGPHVEIHRLEQICKEWGIDTRATTKDQQERIATKFEVKIYELLGDRISSDSITFDGLERLEILDICYELSQYLTSQFSTAPISRDVISESIGRSVRALSYRESLIYRDWQDAIGDAMLERDEDSPRKYKLIGYSQFHELMDLDKPWIERFWTSINDINFDIIDPNDFRRRQIERLAVAVAKTVIEIRKDDNSLAADDATIKVANQLIEVLGSR